MKALVLLSFAVAGCATPMPSPLPPALVKPNAVPGIPVAAETVATPGLRKAYYVGQIIDPAHPELMYRPGIVYREEVRERWNRNPVSGALAAIPDPAILPPSSAEQQQLIAQQQRALELLGNPPATVEKPAEPAPVRKESPTPATPDLSRALVPNADGAIELSPEILDEVDRSEPNPFVKRYQAQPQYRELVVTVTGTSPGPKPVATINGRLVQVGDTWESFRVHAITRDAVFLERDTFLLQIPLARVRAVTVRMPQ